MASLARDAFRGAFNDDDLPRLMRLYDEGAPRMAASKKRESSTRSRACSRIRNSCIGSSRSPTRRRPGAAYPLSSVELASRLSFFLWSSIPDAELLEHFAASGRLDDAEVLEQQVGAYARRPARRDAGIELRVPMAGPWRARELGAGSVRVRRCRPQHSRPLRHRVAPVRRQRLPLGVERARALDGRLHVRQRSASAALRNERRAWHALSACRADGPEPLRLARQRRRAARVVVSESHFARAARPVAARRT